MIREVVLLGDPRLKQKSQDIVHFDNEIKSLVADMFDTMYAANGIGLAAVQVGELKNLFIVDIPEVTPNPMVMINTKILTTSKERMVYEEGCLSIPKLKWQISRPKTITVEYQDITGAKKTLTAEDLFSICIQHEWDHTQGTLFIERAPEKQRKEIDDGLAEYDFPPYFFPKKKSKKFHPK
jgi:peptide deformylase